MLTRMSVHIHVDQNVSLKYMLADTQTFRPNAAGDTGGWWYLNWGGRIVVMSGTELMEWYQTHVFHFVDCISIHSIPAIIMSCPPLTSLLWSDQMSIEVQSNWSCSTNTHANMKTNPLSL